MARSSLCLAAFLCYAVVATGTGPAPVHHKSDISTDAATSIGTRTGRPEQEHLLRSSSNSTSVAAKHDAAVASLPTSAHMMVRTMKDPGSFMVAVFLLFLVVSYTFLAMAILCDDFMVPFIEEVCIRAAIPDEVAGASLLAFGSSAPELVMTSVATVHAKADLSLGALMGSALIAFGLITAISALVAIFQGKKNSSDEGGRVVKFATWPVMRDTCAYVLCLAILWNAVLDGAIDAGESATLIALYVVYLGVVFAPSLLKRRRAGALVRSNSVGDAVPKRTYETFAKVAEADAEAEVAAGSATRSAAALVKDMVEEKAQAGGEAGGDGCDAAKVGSALAAPIYFVFRWTFPGPSNCGEEEDDDEKESGKTVQIENKLSNGMVALGVVMSIAWIALLSEAAILEASAIVSLTGLSGTSAGASVLALGAQIPDTMASVAMARKGLAEGALSNAIGSQVMNVSLGVGLPFLIYAIAHGHGMITGHHPSKPVLLLGLLLAFVIVVFLLAALPCDLLCTVCAPPNRRCSRASCARRSRLRPAGAVVILCAFVWAYLCYFTLSSVCFKHNHCAMELHVCAIGRVVGC